jgi:hypothetical protein
LSFELPTCSSTRISSPTKANRDNIVAMAEKMEGIQMGVDPSKYPVPIET